ncbi:2-dehydropantoate 2-reductase [Catenovulum agarivorans DS-2]|uniref:2-dehydropantoate 2-reductase n=1 Tax=Catenovulum agarivorans DS-2 TaxID=1328313 RepID=W7QQU3_9ALTE|nr:2-dehydropantoate 2-reductase [Catenovulum agarivorans]EWH11362.1 2-dehydropantoate 2-reductase [Catenovulum agarivorans DS-2]
MLTILGCGAIGATIAHHCYTNALPFNTVIRGVSASFSQNSRLKFTDINQREFNLSLPPANSPITNLLITVKAYQVEDAIKQLLKQQTIVDNASIVLLHNGMGTKHIVQSLLPNAKVLSATTTYAAFARNKLDVIQTGIGEVLLECNNAKSDSLAQLVESWPQASWQPNIQTILWQKLFINCAINPLTAIYQIQNGRLTEQFFTGKVKALLDEINLVAQLVCPQLTIDKIEQAVFDIINKTADNFSSMNRDVASKRQTEIDFITGHLLNIAARYALKLPVNQALYQQVKQLEAQY